MSVWHHVARTHLNQYCDCRSTFKALWDVTKHMVARGCEEVTAGPGYVHKIFKMMMAVKEDAPYPPPPMSAIHSLVEPITDDELDYDDERHMPDFTYPSGVLNYLDSLEDVNNIPVDFYMSESESVSKSDMDLSP